MQIHRKQVHRAKETKMDYRINDQGYTWLKMDLGINELKGIPGALVNDKFWQKNLQQQRAILMILRRMPIPCILLHKYRSQTKAWMRWPSCGECKRHVGL